MELSNSINYFSQDQYWNELIKYVATAESIDTNELLQKIEAAHNPERTRVSIMMRLMNDGFISWTLEHTLNIVEKMAILDCIDANTLHNGDYNLTEVARQLDVNRGNFYRMLDAHGIEYRDRHDTH